MTADKKTNKPIKCPQKVGINLNMHENRVGTNTTTIAALVVMAVVVAFVAKFGVYDQYAKVAQAEKSYAVIHNQYVSLEKELADYNDVLNEYRMYSRDWMTESKKDSPYVSVDRLDVLNLVEEKMMTKGEVSGIYISGEEVSVAMSGMNLDEISNMFLELEESEIVKTVSLDVAQTEEAKPASVLRFTVNMTLKGVSDK